MRRKKVNVGEAGGRTHMYPRLLTVQEIYIKKTLYNLFLDYLSLLHQPCL